MTDTLGNNGNYYPGSSIGNNGNFYPGSSNGQYIPANANNNPYVPPGGNSFGANGYTEPAPGTAVAFSAVRANTNSNYATSTVRFDRTITDIGYGWDPAQSHFE